MQVFRICFVYLSVKSVRRRIGRLQSLDFFGRLLAPVGNKGLVALEIQLFDAPKLISFIVSHQYQIALE